MKKILNKFHHRALCANHDIVFGDFTEKEYHQKLNKLAQIFKFQSMWNPQHFLQQKSVKFHKQNPVSSS